jgi:DNA-directed RNA polymerase subunit RPC12/RpoP
VLSKDLEVDAMSSKRRLRRNTCGHKIGHTEEAARAAIRALRRTGAVLAALTPYRCPYCGAFHIGHPPRNVRQAIQARQGQKLNEIGRRAHRFR